MTLRTAFATLPSDFDSWSTAMSRSDLLSTSSPAALARTLPTAAESSDGVRPPVPGPDLNYWHGFIDERGAAEFLGFTVRCLQGWRYRGKGPVYRKIGRVRYRRIDLTAWADDRLRTSTSDPGQAA